MAYVSQNYKDYSSISELSCLFEGVDIGDINSSGLVTDWGITVKTIALYSTIYPMVLSSEEVSTDLLNDLSLKIWGYRKKPRG